MPFVSSVRGNFTAVGKRPSFPATNSTGGTITTAGGYRIHTFTSGTTPFTFTHAAGEGTALEILIIGGGGGGGSIGGGGGAGGYIYGTTRILNGTYPLVVGPGGNSSGGGHGAGVVGTKGTPSTGFGMTAIGGGHGCGWSSWQTEPSGYGGSGGGGTGPSVGKPAEQPSANSGVLLQGLTQVGHKGADGGELNDEVGNTGSPGHQGGGGGGAGDRGIGRGGGAGLYSSISGTSVGRGGGGGGGVHTSAPNNLHSPNYSTVGIPFGGGAGAGSNATGTYPGTANTGGGGGGAFHNTDSPTGAGGSGVIIVRYIV